MLGHSIIVARDGPKRYASFVAKARTVNQVIGHTIMIAPQRYVNVFFFMGKDMLIFVTKARTVNQYSTYESAMGPHDDLDPIETIPPLPSPPPHGLLINLTTKKGTLAARTPQAKDLAREPPPPPVSSFLSPSVPPSFLYSICISRGWMDQPSPQRIIRRADTSPVHSFQLQLHIIIKIIRVLNEFLN